MEEAAIVLVLVRYDRVVFVLQVRRLEKRRELHDAQNTTEVSWNAPMRLERRSNVVAVAASLALMARRAKKMKRNCRFAIAALQHLVQQIARTHAVS